MKLPGLQREKVLATVVQLLEKTLIRVGNAEYAQHNHSYGLTTLRNKHVKVKGSEVTFKFTGKSGKQWNLSLHDRRIAAIVKKSEEIPGQELFKYIDEQGQIVDVTSGDVNAYLREISGEHFTAKDYRTWSATVLAALALQEFEKVDSKAQAKKNVLRAIEKVSKHLGNTPAMARKSYIHPEVISSYLDGEFVKMVEQEIDEEFHKKFSSLNAPEIMVLALLHKRLSKTALKS
jgi:DNA topoisomerase-1